MLLDRILELEAAVPPSSPSPHSPNPHPHSQTPTAFPRTLQSAHAQTAFQANLHEALEEVRSEDPAVDPLYSSRHIGPQARKRQLEEMKEREEEEARDARKAPRRGKAATAPHPSKAKDTGAPPPFTPPTNPSGSPAAVPTSTQTLVTSSGKRIRIKPPAAAPPEPAPPPHTSHGMHRIPQFINNAGVPPTTHQLSPGSPMSPLGSDEHHTVTDGDSSAVFHNANGNSALDTASQLGPTSPTSLAASATSIPSTAVQRHTKPKRLKAHTVTSKSYSIPMVPRDKNGKPILPLNVGIMTVNCLGDVCMREHFHTERYIFPVGYSVNRYGL
jgi:F/Y rich protein